VANGPLAPSLRPHGIRVHVVPFGDDPSWAAVTAAAMLVEDGDAALVRGRPAAPASRLGSAAREHVLRAYGPGGVADGVATPFACMAVPPHLAPAAGERMAPARKRR
jgi:hypothetical protein